MKDEIKEQMIKYIAEKGLMLRESGYWQAVKGLSDAFGVPFKFMDEYKEYWFTKDPSVLSEEAKNALFDYYCAFLNCAEARTEDEDHE